MKKSIPLLSPFEQDKEDSKQSIFAEFMSVGIAFRILVALAVVHLKCIAQLPNPREFDTIAT